MLLTSEFQNFFRGVRAVTCQLWHCSSAKAYFKRPPPAQTMAEVWERFLRDGFVLLFSDSFFHCGCFFFFKLVWKIVIQSHTRTLAHTQKRIYNKEMPLPQSSMFLF